MRTSLKAAIAVAIILSGHQTGVASGLGIDELRVGAAATLSKGTSASAEIQALFSPLHPMTDTYKRDLAWIFSPRPMIGAAPNLHGKTSFLYGGLLWTVPMPHRFFLEFSFGGLMHDQDLDRVYQDRTSPLSTRLLFRESIGIGYKLGGDLRVIVFADHASNGGLGYRNEAINRVGLLLGKVFEDPASAKAISATPLHPYVWNGPYVGFGAGLARGRFHFTSPSPTDGAEADSSVNLSGLAGYNFQFGDLVFGAEADLAVEAQNGSADLAPLASSLSASSHWLATVRGRVGRLFVLPYASMPVLAYGTGGLALSRIAADYCFSSAAQCYDASGNVAGGWSEQSAIRAGWALGTGIEVPLADRVTGKLEYLYVDFGRLNFTTPKFSETFSYSEHVFRAGMNFKLN